MTVICTKIAESSINVVYLVLVLLLALCMLINEKLN